MIQRIFSRTLKNGYSSYLKYSSYNLCLNQSLTKNFSSKSATPDVFKNRNNNYRLKDTEQNSLQKSNPKREKRNFTLDKIDKKVGHDGIISEWKDLSASFREQYGAKISQISDVNDISKEDLNNYCDVLEQLNMKIYDCYMNIKTSIKYNQQMKKVDFKIMNTENYEQYITNKYFETMTTNVVVGEFNFYNNILKILVQNIDNHIFVNNNKNYDSEITNKVLKTQSTSFSKIKFFDFFSKTTSTCEFLKIYSKLILKITEVINKNYKDTENKYAPMLDDNINRKVLAFIMNAPIYLCQFEKHSTSDNLKYSELREVSQILKETVRKIIPNLKNIKGLQYIMLIRIYVQTLTAYSDLRYQDEQMRLITNELNIEVKIQGTFFEKIDNDYLNNKLQDQKFHEFENEIREFQENNLTLMGEVLNKARKGDNKTKPLTSLLQRFFLKQIWEIRDKMGYHIPFRGISQTLWHFMKVQPELNLSNEDHQYYKKNIRDYYLDLNVANFVFADSLSLSMTVKAQVSMNFYDDLQSQKSWRLFYELIASRLDENKKNEDLLLSSILNFIGTSLVGGYKIGNFLTLIYHRFEFIQFDGRIH